MPCPRKNHGHFCDTNPLESTLKEIPRYVLCLTGSHVEEFLLYITHVGVNLQLFFACETFQTALPKFSCKQLIGVSYLPPVNLNQIIICSTKKVPSKTEHYAC